MIAGPASRVARSTPHRSRARRGDGPRLRAEILSAAERLLIETGDESAVSIRAVAQAVGVTAPSIYLHFADRNELIFEVCEEQFRHLDETMEQAVAGVTDPWERVDRKGRAYVEFGLNNPEQYRILFTSRPDCTPERFMDERLVSTSAFGHLVEDLLAAMAGGQLAPSAGVAPSAEQAALVACGLWMMVHGITSLLIAKPDFPWPDRQQLIDHVLQTYSAGLRSAGGVAAVAAVSTDASGGGWGVSAGAAGGGVATSGAPAGGGRIDEC